MQTCIQQPLQIDSVKEQSTVSDDTLVIQFTNGIRLSVLRRGRWCVGILHVSYRGKALRCERECIMPEIATPDGFEVLGYELLDVEESADGVVVRTRPYFRVGHRMQWTEHALHPRINTASWSHEPFSPEGAIFEWVIREENTSYDGVQYAGFSYGFHYRCAGYPIYQIEDKASWELGGHADGNTFIMRGTCAPVIVQLKDNEAYYSGWNLPGIANPYIFQHIPLYTHFQGFTYQYDAEHVLLTVHERPSHVRSLFQKERSSELLLHFNQFCFDLTDDIATPARKVFVAAHRGSSQSTRFNHFLRVRDEIQQAIREYYGVTLDHPRPAMQVETWGIARVEQFAKIFRQLAHWHIQRVYLMPLWRCDATDIAPRFMHDREQFAHFGNMCCPLELEIADCYGGWDGFKEILAPAVERGLEVYMWFGSHFSPHSPLWSRIKDLAARDASGQRDRNNYDGDLLAVNQNSKAYQAYLFDHYRKAKAYGLRGIFRDSHFNMATDTLCFLHQPYADEQAISATIDQVGNVKAGELREQAMISSMHDTEASIQRYFQRELGMLYYVESAGVLGTPGCGTNYDWIRGNEFIFSEMETGLNGQRVLEHGDSVEEAYFKGLSVRLIYRAALEVNKFPDAGSTSDWWNPETMVPLIRAYLQVEPYMQQLWLLEDGNGTRWVGGESDVIFAYKSFSYPLDGTYQVQDVLGGTGYLVDNEVSLHAGKIYLFTKLK